MANTNSDLPSSEDRDRLIDDIREHIRYIPQVKGEKRLKLQRLILKESGIIDRRIEDFRGHLNHMRISDPRIAESLIKLFELKTTIKESLLNIYTTSKKLM
ncbi:hypothetical protein ACFLTP_01805 [Chloroflexota bacterium]